MYAGGWPDQVSRGSFEYDHGLYAEAVASYKTALPLADSQQTRGVTLYRLALAEQKVGRLAEAEEHYKDALTIFRNGADLPKLALSLAALGETYRAQSRFDEALATERHAGEILKTLGMDGTQQASDVFSIIGEVLYDQHRLRAAEQYTEKALLIREKALGPHDEDVGASLNNLGAIVSDRKRQAEAEMLLRRALEIRERHFGAEHPLVAGTLVNLSSVYLEEKRYAEAERLCRQAIVTMQRFLPTGHPDLLRAQILLALIARRSGAPNRALDILKRAVQSAEIQPVNLTGEYLQLLDLYSQYLREAGEKQESRQFRMQVSELSRQFRTAVTATTVTVGELQPAQH
jgi:tetratricopeptide (TPR) repeat protein